MGYYSYYKRKKRTKPFKSVDRKIYKPTPKKTYWELKEQDKAIDSQMNPILEEDFKVILKAALDYAKNNKN